MKKAKTTQVSVTPQAIQRPEVHGWQPSGINVDENIVSMMDLLIGFPKQEVMMKKLPGNGKSRRKSILFRMARVKQY